MVYKDIKGNILKVGDYYQETAVYSTSPDIIVQITAIKENNLFAKVILCKPPKLYTKMRQAHGWISPDKYLSLVGKRLVSVERDGNMWDYFAKKMKAKRLLKLPVEIEHESTTTISPKKVSPKKTPTPKPKVTLVKKKKEVKKRKISPASIAVLKTLNKTADSLQRQAGTTEKTIKVQKLSRKEALRKAGQLYKKR